MYAKINFKWKIESTSLETIMYWLKDMISVAITKL